MTNATSFMPLGIKFHEILYMPIHLMTKVTSVLGVL